MITTTVKKIIQDAIPDAQVYVQDPMNDGQHLQAIVVSKNFEGLPLVKQYQMVMRALKQAFAESVHALGLKTMTPAQWSDYQKKN